MGNAVQHVSIRKDATAQSDDSVVSTYENGTGRLVATHEQQAQDTKLYTAAGERATVGMGSSDGQGNFGAERTHYYYRPDGLLIAVDHRTCSYGAPATSCVVTGSLGSLITLTGAFEDYRYDALGRRVQVRTRADTVCTGAIGRCVSSLMWVAWDGNAIAEETRGAGGGMVSADSLERDLPPGDTALAPFYGTVAYLNGPTMDEPLEIQGIQPYHTWRGLIDGGDCLTGDCGVGPIDWPGLTYEANLSVIPSRQHIARSWHGSMFTEGQDDGGLMYRRNRYYDPATGQFTQEDPLGLAGGMNAYGFGSGDPVNFTDPFGLCSKADGYKDCCHMSSSPDDAAMVYMSLLVSLSDALNGRSVPGDGAAGAVVGEMAHDGEALGTRYVGQGEADEISRTGTVPANYQSGAAKTIHYTTDEPTMSAQEALEKYHLDTKPTHLVRFPLRNIQDEAKTLGTVRADATQVATSKPIPGAHAPIPLQP